ncbi:MAG: hypothetical protein ACYTEV_07795 [Planctomycetota bacterium]
MRLDELPLTGRSIVPNDEPATPAAAPVRTDNPSDAASEKQAEPPLIGGLPDAGPSRVPTIIEEPADARRSAPSPAPAPSRAAAPAPAPRRRSEPIILDAGDGGDADGGPASPASLPETPVTPNPVAAVTAEVTPAEPARRSEPIIGPRTITAVAPADDAEPLEESIDPRVLRSLLDQAEQATDRLRDAVAAAESAGDEPGRMADELHERLRLGARMLKAFEAQIERVEETMADAQRRAESAGRLDEAREEAIAALNAARIAETDRVKKELAAVLNEARAAIDERALRRERPAVEIERIIEQVERHVADAVRRIDAHARATMPEVPSQESIDQRIERSVQSATSRFDRHAQQVRMELETEARSATLLRQQIAATGERIEAAEAKADDLAERVDESARTMKAEVEEARAMARRCLDVRSGLAAELRKVVNGMESVAGRGERMRIDVEEQLDRFERLREEVTESLASLESVVRRVDRIEGTVERLERLADRLAPWEQMLLTGEVTEDGLPRPAAEMIDRLQSGIGRDVDSLSRTMREMAERMAGIAGGGGGGASGRRTAPAVETTLRTSVPTVRANPGRKPAQSAEPRPDRPMPGRPDTSELLAAIEDETRRAAARPAKDATNPKGEEPGQPPLHLRRTGTD